MGKLLLILAGAAALGMALVHVILGGPKVLDPLFASQLAEDVKWLAYFTWHDGTVALIVSGVGLIYSAVTSGQRMVGCFSAIMLTGFGLLGLGTALLGNPVIFETPAPYAFLPLGLAGLLGFALNRR